MMGRSEVIKRDAIRRAESRHRLRVLPATALLVASLAGGVLAGCSSAPPLKHVLLAPPRANRVPPKHSNWQVAQVKVPAYLDSYDINYRSGSFVIDHLPNAKWAQRLPTGITALLQSTIDGQLHTDRSRPYKVTVAVSTFAPQPSGKVVLSARWQVKNRDSGHVVAQDATVIEQPLAVKKRTPETVGRAMSLAVRKLGHRIVAAAG